MAILGYHKEELQGCTSYYAFTPEGTFEVVVYNNDVVTYKDDNTHEYRLNGKPAGLHTIHHEIERHFDIPRKAMHLLIKAEVDKAIAEYKDTTTISDPRPHLRLAKFLLIKAEEINGCPMGFSDKFFGMGGNVQDLLLIIQEWIKSYDEEEEGL